MSDSLGLRNLRWRRIESVVVVRLYLRWDTDIEQFLNIVELAMDISNEIDGWGEILNIGFGEQYFLYFFAEVLDGAFFDDLLFLDALDYVMNIHAD